MIVALYVTLGVLLILYICALALLCVVVLDTLVRGHSLPTSRRAIRALATVIRQYKPDTKQFYDLGCAHGALALFLKKILPDLEIHAVDNSNIRIFVATLKARLLRRSIDFTKNDIFNVDVSNADVVYTYLWYDLMPALEKKLQADLKPGAIVVTNTSHFPTWQHVQKVVTYPKIPTTPDFETLFVYVKT